MKKIVDREEGGSTRPGTGGGIVPKKVKDKTGTIIAVVVVVIALLVAISSQ